MSILELLVRVTMRGLIFTPSFLLLNRRPFYYYRPQRSCEGYVFTSVCLSTGRVSASVHAGIPPPPEQIPPQSGHPPEQTPPGADSPRPDTIPPEQTPHPPGADTPPPLEQTPGSRSPSREQPPPPPRYGHCYGRYASYWNAFLCCLWVCPETSPTRKHSSRMHTAPLPAVRLSVATRCQHWWGIPQVNKFEWVSSLGDHVSTRVEEGKVPCLEGDCPLSSGVPCPRVGLTDCKVIC